MILTLAAAIIALSAWTGLRWHNGAKLRPVVPLLLDAALATWCWAVVSLVTDRLLVGAIVVGFGAIGLAIADDAKFDALRERLAFSDRAELLEVVRHPEMYLPFAGTGVVLAGVAVLAGVVGVLVWYEPPMLPHWWLAPPFLFALGSVYFSLAIPQVLRFLGRLFYSWSPNCVPDTDIPRYGLLACFVIHATIARFERNGRRAPYSPQDITRPQIVPAKRSVILVQFESFFDVKRLGGAFGAGAPNLLKIQSRATHFGSLEVPCWGANTIRTEFAALTGVDVRELGLDQYNPYERFAQHPVDSLAWEMRRRGLKTVCIHPFDLNFYGRSKVMPKLGFERLIGPKAFQRESSHGYVSDQAIVERIALELAGAQNAGSASLVFAITIAAHGPWQERGFPQDTKRGKAAEGISAYLEAVAKMDDTLPRLKLLADEHDALLIIYGDHQPSLPKAFGSIEFVDPRTDYLIYDPRNRNAPGSANRYRDLAAHELKGMILQVFEREMGIAGSVILA